MPAISLATLKRAKQIVLFGYDYKPANQQAFHVYERHYERKRSQNASWWANWARSYGILKTALDKRGITVINASTTSLVAAFPKMSPNEALHWILSEGRK